VVVAAGASAAPKAETNPQGQPPKVQKVMVGQEQTQTPAERLLQQEKRERLMQELRRLYGGEVAF